MNKKLKLVLIIFAALIVLGAGVFALYKYTDLFEPEPTPTPTPAPTATPVPTPTATPEHVNVTTAQIAFGGDIVMHTGLNAEAKNGDNYDYTPIFGVIGEEIKSADYSVCTLVTTFASGTEYTAFPRYHSPSSLAGSIAAVGFNLVNTATSNAMDSNKAGLDFTLDRLDEAGLFHVGTYRSAEERSATSGVTYADINGVKVAFLSYTCDTNRIPVAGFEYAVNVCTTDYLGDAVSVDYDRMDDDMLKAREGGADAVVVLMSWGEEFSTEPSDLQSEMADHLFAAGADVIVGGHTRVPQPMEKRDIIDKDGNKKTGFICYSLGNLLSCQNDGYTDISAILNLTFSKDTDTGYTWISDVGYVPICMADLYDYGIEDYGWHYRLVNLHNAINSYESGEPWSFISAEVYETFKNNLTYLHEFFGPELDAVKAEQTAAQETTEEPEETPAEEPTEAPTEEPSEPVT